jgi:predicted nucleotidyltransferase
VITGRDTMADVPGHLARPLTELVTALHACLGDDLVSVVLYGGAARGEHQRGRSDANLLVVLERVEPKHLRAVAREVRRARKRIRLSPVFVSREELVGAADTFAVELADMQEQHVVLYGDDVLANLRIDPEHLRLQVEHELRGKLSRLRQNYLRDAEDTRAVIRLMVNSFSSFVTLFAALLRLRGKRPARKRAELLNQAAAELGLDGELLARLLAAHRGERAIPKADAHAVFESYLRVVESAVRSADRAGGL